MASLAQRAKIEALRIDLEWGQEGLSGFLAERHYSHGGNMGSILTSRDASEVIELLKAVLAKQSAARTKGGRPNAGHRPDDGTEANTTTNEGCLGAGSTAARSRIEGP